MEIIHLLTESGPPVSYVFGNGVRADMLGGDMLSALKAMGVHTLGLGIETASPDIARRAGKPLDLKHIGEVISTAHDLGFAIWAFFMIGLPGETGETVRRTVDFACSLPIDVAKFEIYTPYPGTELYSELMEKGRIMERAWRKWGIHTPPVHRLAAMPPADMLAARRKAVLRFYLRPRLLLRHLRRNRTYRGFSLNMGALRFLIHTILTPG